MKKFLISSIYMYYDDFNFSNVCITDTKEKAEELIVEFNKNKEIFKTLKGYILYLDKEFFEKSIFSEYDNKYIDFGDSYIKVFITNEQFQTHKELFEKLEIYYQENTYFEFLTFFHISKDLIDHEYNLIKKYCNHEDAQLFIEEIDCL